MHCLQRDLLKLSPKLPAIPFNARAAYARDPNVGTIRKQNKQSVKVTESAQSMSRTLIGSIGFRDAPRAPGSSGLELFFSEDRLYANHRDLSKHSG
jgi:hypothetical protein